MLPVLVYRFDVDELDIIKTALQDIERLQQDIRTDADRIKQLQEDVAKREAQLDTLEQKVLEAEQRTVADMQTAKGILQTLVDRVTKQNAAPAPQS